MNSDLEQVFGSASAALRSGNESEALGLLNQLVNAGDARGAECLGYVYEAKGRSDPKYYKESYRWYVISLEMGETVNAHRGLARYYYFGYGGDRDLARAEEHLERAEPETSPQVALMLGEVLFGRASLAEEIERAERLFFVAASAGYPAGTLGMARVARSKSRYLRYVFLKTSATWSAAKLALQSKRDARLFGLGDLGTVE